VGTYDQYIATTGDGDIDVPLSPGVVVPSGDSLCLFTYGSLEATVSASGYTIPAAAATNEPIHRVVPTAVPTPASS
jgi:glutamine synthetase type III